MAVALVVAEGQLVARGLGRAARPCGAPQPRWRLLRPRPEARIVALDPRARGLAPLGVVVLLACQVVLWQEAIPAGAGAGDGGAAGM